MTRDPDLEGLLRQAEALRAQSDALLQTAKLLEKEVRRLAARQPKNGHPEILQARSTGRIKKPGEAVAADCTVRSPSGEQCALLRGHSRAHSFLRYDIRIADFDFDVPF